MARPELNDYLKLIYLKAWQTWHKLPPQHKGWIDIDDLIQDGVMFARFQALPRFRPHRAGFATFLALGLDNYYKNRLAEYFTHKRNDCQVVPVCSVQYCLTKRDRMEREVHAVRSLYRIVLEASPILRRYLNRWLFADGHMHCRGARFATARSELRQLSKKCGFDRDDFEYLLLSDGWRREFQPVQSKFLTSRTRSATRNL